LLGGIKGLYVSDICESFGGRFGESYSTVCWLEGCVAYRERSLCCAANFLAANRTDTLFSINSDREMNTNLTMMMVILITVHFSFSFIDVIV